MELYSDIMYDIWQEECRIAIEEHHIKKEFKEKLRGLINITGLWRHLDEGQDWWLPDEIVEVENTGEKLSGYPNYDTGRIVNDEIRALYLKQTEYEIRGIKHVYVYQRSHGEDLYSGSLLYPLKDGKYIKINFNC